jgi:hypothetical protein
MTLTWDLFILLFFAVCTIYGFLIGRNKIMGILVNLYLAYVVTTVVGDKVYDVMSNFRFVSNNLATSVFGSKVLLMVVITGLLSLKSELSTLDTAGSLSKVQTGILGFLASGFVLSAAFSFMSSSELIGLNSNFALLVNNYQVVWVVAPVLVIIGLSFFNKR